MAPPTKGRVLHEGRKKEEEEKEKEEACRQCMGHTHRGPFQWNSSSQGCSSYVGRLALLLPPARGRKKAEGL